MDKAVVRQQGDGSWAVYANGIVYLGKTYECEGGAWGFTTVDGKVYRDLASHEMAVAGLLKAVWGK